MSQRFPKGEFSFLRNAAAIFLEARKTDIVSPRSNAARRSSGPMISQGATGLGFAAHTARCTALWVASLDDVADVTECLRRQHVCRTDQLLERAFLRLEEMLNLAD